MINSVPGVALTLPTHPVIAVLKVWRPRWFDGVALVVGSMAPDLAYALDGSGLPVWKMSHGLRGFVLWCVPVTLALTWLIRWAAPVVASHLPHFLRDYGVLGHSRHPLRVSCWSTLIGAVSHLLLDFAELQLPVAEYVMHVLGALGLLALMVHVRRHRGRAQSARHQHIGAEVDVSEQRRAETAGAGQEG